VVYLKVYKGRIPGLSGPATITYIFCGLVPYLTIAQGMANGVGSIISNKAVLSNTVFPIDLAPVQSALSAQAVMCVGMPLIVIGAALTGHAHPTLAAFPLIWLLMVIWLVGVNWVISILNTLFRDLQALLTAVLMILLIASPFAYTPSQVPSTLKPLLLLNPFAYFVIAYQQVIMLGELPDAAHVAVLVLMPALTFLFGSWFFAKTKSVAIDYV
jgi:lipopolysaccharide transport system permease protein